MAIKKAKIITISSVKGGVGKTTTTLTLAGVLALKGKKTLILDLDLYSGAVAASLDLDITTDLYRLINDLMINKFDNMENYVCNYLKNLDVIPAPKDPRLANKINSKYLSLALKKLSMIYDVILIDTNHALTDIHLLALDSSDEVFYLITDDLIDLKNMKSMITIYEDMEKANYKLIVNSSLDKDNSYFTDYDIKNILGRDVDYVIPRSFNFKNIDNYVVKGKILSIVEPRKCQIFHLIADDILKEEK